MNIYHAPHAWVAGRVARDVLIEVADGRIVAVTPNMRPAGERLPGMVLPGFANAHSHAFHRALRGRTHKGGGSFWSWRDLMYGVAGRLSPEEYLELATAVYAEMALTGITAVGEFHYLHHGPDGMPYVEPNIMGLMLAEAAARAGIRITLLDTLYLTSGVDGRPLEGVQRRFSDGDLTGWQERVAGLKAGAHVRVGAAIHSVRAVPPAFFAGLLGHGPLHVHLSEQRAENEQCREVHGCTPAELLDRHGVLGPGTTVVHATHLTDSDVRLLGRTGTGVCFCPTTERDLADGIGRARDLVDAGAPLSLGSDSHAVIDMFEEIRGVEMNERLASRRRGRFSAGELIAAAAAHKALGWDDAGSIAAGMRADLVCVRTDSVRTAGAGPDGVVFAATAADVTHVMADGRMIVANGRHVSIDVESALLKALDL